MIDFERWWNESDWLEIGNIYEIAEAAWQAARRWIPVSERLPEIGKTGVYASDFVLAYDGDEVLMCKYIQTDAKCWWQDTFPNLRYDAQYITHWQPLPPPPEEK